MDPTNPQPDDDPRTRPSRSAGPIDLGSFVVTADAGQGRPASSPGPLPGPRPSPAPCPIPGMAPEPPPSCPETIEGLPPFELRALRIVESGWGAGWELRPAPPRRPWMDEHTHAYHCLPLVVANQWGWEVLFPADVRVSWDGSPGLEGLKVEVDPQYRDAVKSQFGRGIVTFSPPWLFRTPPGWDLFAKGPSNRWKGNCAPLEGIIETWWIPYTFTFNWKLIKPGEVRFEGGECIGQILPVPHRTFAGARFVEQSLAVEPGLAARMGAWRDERRKRAGQRNQNHLMYRKAQDVQGHLVRVPVPRAGAGGDGPGAGPPEAGRGDLPGGE